MRSAQNGFWEIGTGPGPEGNKQLNFVSRLPNQGSVRSVRKVSVGRDSATKDNCATEGAPFLRAAGRFAGTDSTLDSIRTVQRDISGILVVPECERESFA